MEKLILTTLSLEDLAAELADRIFALQQKTYQEPTPLVREEYLGVNQAAEFLGLAVATLYTLTCRKKIPYIKKGKKLYFNRTDLEAWLQSGRRNPGDKSIPTRELFLRNKRKAV